MANLITVSAYRIQLDPQRAQFTVLQRTTESIPVSRIKAISAFPDEDRLRGLPRIYGRVITIDPDPMEYLTAETVAQLQTLANA